jgi:hypothetical protein
VVHSCANSLFLGFLTLQQPSRQIQMEMQERLIRQRKKDQELRW